MSSYLSVDEWIDNANVSTYPRFYRSDQESRAIQEGRLRFLIV